MQKPSFNVSLRLPQDMWDRFMQLSQAEDITPGKYIMNLLRQYLADLDQGSLPDPSPFKVNSEKAGG